MTVGDDTIEQQELLPFHTYQFAFDNPLLRPDGSVNKSNKVWADADDYRYALDIDPNRRMKTSLNMLMVHTHFNANDQHMRRRRVCCALDTANALLSGDAVRERDVSFFL